MTRRKRSAIPIAVQCAIYRRDHWLCYLCKRPLIFPMAMKLLQESVAASAAGPLPAYYDPQWRRDLAPLLDELACSIDHIEAFSAGGEDDPGNFAAICARCNARKSARPKDAFLEDARPWRVRSKHGEPERWDGMTSVFVSLASTTGRKLTPHESAWLKALQSDPG